jgi:phage baseplate assembly protein W
MSKQKSLGVNYPIQRSSDGYFDRTFTTLEHTKANIINVLSTKQGERLARPEFGTNLEELLFEPMSQQLEEDIRREINSAINRSLPYVEVKALNVRRDDEKKLASVDIDFTTPFLPKEKEENVELFFELSDQPD